MQTAPTVNVYAPNGRFMFSTHRDEAIRLLRNQQAYRLGKNGQMVRDIELAARDESDEPYDSEGPTLSQSRSTVSHKIQAKGAKRWVIRLDRADSGQTASHRRIVSPLAHPDRRYGIGKAKEPQGQFA